MRLGLWQGMGSFNSPGAVYKNRRLNKYTFEVTSFDPYWSPINFHKTFRPIQTKLYPVNAATTRGFFWGRVGLEKSPLPKWTFVHLPWWKLALSLWTLSSCASNFTVEDKEACNMMERLRKRFWPHATTTALFRSHSTSLLSQKLTHCTSSQPHSFHHLPIPLPSLAQVGGSRLPAHTCSTSNCTGGLTALVQWCWWAQKHRAIQALLQRFCGLCTFCPFCQ